MRDPSSLRDKVRKAISNYRLLNNFSLKIFSLIFAAGLWLFVTNYHDPEIATTFSNISVKLLHTDTLENQGKVVTVIDNSDTISIVTVNASRSVVESLGQDNIVATADLDAMTEDGRVPIVLTTNRAVDSISSITGSSSYVEVSVEDRTTKKFTLETETVGEVEDGYVLGSVTMEQNQLRVSGPASIVSQISSAGVIVDVSDSTGTISTNADIHLYDEDGVDIEISKNLTLNVERIAVVVEVLPTKEITLTAGISGVPEDGYEYTGEYTIVPSTIVVAGKKSALDELDGIIIPASAVNVTGANDDVIIEVDVSDYLPDGIQFAEKDGDTSVTISVEIVKKATIEAPSEE